MYFILGAMLSITIVKRRYYLFVIGVWISAFLASVALEYSFPEMVTTDEANRFRGPEHIIATIGIMLFIAAMLSEQHEIFRTGMDEYISKPFNPEELLSKIQKQLRSTTA